MAAIKSAPVAATSKNSLSMARDPSQARSSSSTYCDTSCSCDSCSWLDCSYCVCWPPSSSDATRSSSELTCQCTCSPPERSTHLGHRWPLVGPVCPAALDQRPKWLRTYCFRRPWRPLARFHQPAHQIQRCVCVALAKFCHKCSPANGGRRVTSSNSVAPNM